MQLSCIREYIHIQLHISDLGLGGMFKFFILFLVLRLPFCPLEIGIKLILHIGIVVDKSAATYKNKRTQYSYQPRGTVSFISRAGHAQLQAVLTASRPPQAGQCSEYEAKPTPIDFEHKEREYGMPEAIHVGIFHAGDQKRK